MQLIGIYLKNAHKSIRKNFKTDCWYPFGKFSDCHIENNKAIVLKELEENKKFINRYYNIQQDGNGPTINLNCIVGKNGSGKSTILAILYRIINNLSCKLKEVLKDYNKDYNPKWAGKFEASLYYEINNEINFIEIYDNIEHDDILETPSHVRLFFSEKKNSNELKDLFTLNYDEKKLINKLGTLLFYTIGTNYSLYSNTNVRYDFDELQERWLTQLYHKNDGYFTPIVLVPYRYDSTIINTEKELKLANERVNTLSILMHNEGSDFIEGLIPYNVEYKLKKEDEYEKDINRKIISFLGPDEQWFSEETDLDTTIVKYRGEEVKGLFPFIRKEWESRLCNKPLLQTSFADVSVIYREIILYLSYKTLKLCTYYDKYKSFFTKGDIFLDFKNDKDNCKKQISKIIEKIEKDPLDFMNLKARQCIRFLEKGDFYLEGAYNLFEGISYKSIEDLENKFLLGTNLTYDEVFINLLPPIFFREYKYKKVLTTSNSKKTDFTISSMSSGEQQFLYSLSYVIYHMKNAASNQFSEERIPYRNMNLIFDEAELYYHPEYQRLFISKLLGILKRSHLEESIDSINITIVTHSPFMLSDIPNSNVLALENGKISDIKTNTLGTNIYDLLSNQFFMKSAIGEHVETIINIIIKEYNEYKEGDEQKKKIIKEKIETNDFYDSFVNRIGDEYLSNVLFDMLNEMKGKTFKDRQREKYERKLRELENE